MTWRVLRSRAVAQAEVLLEVLEVGATDIPQLHVFEVQQKRNPGVTEIAELPGRGHALTIDDGWRDVADTALRFIQRFRLGGGTLGAS